MRDSFFSSASTSSHSSIEDVEITTVETFEVAEHGSPSLHLTDQCILQNAFRESVQRRKQTAKAWLAVRSKEIEEYHNENRRHQTALPGVVSYD